MQPVPDWRAVIRHAWSFRLLALAAVLSGAEVALPLLGYRLPIGEITRALLYFAITAAALVARVVLQRRMRP